jgi:two-component system response regulator DctR
MNNKDCTVRIIEDDDDLAKAITILLESESFSCYRYASAEEFLEELDTEDEKLNCQINSSKPNSFLIDIRLSGTSGLSLFYNLMERPGDKLSPVIFLTGHGDLEMAVDCLKKGAFDFLTKPYKSEELLETLRSSLKESEFRIEQQNYVSQFEEKLNSLTSRERELVEPISSGLSNKEIALNFENSIRTIELHRARVFEKLEVQSAVELAKIIERFNTLNNDLNS